MCHLSRLTVCVCVLWPLVFLWTGSISFISLFPLWNKSHNDSKEQVAFRWHSVRYEIESYITISTSVLFCVHVCIYIIAILCTAHTSTWWFVYINCQLFLSNWVIFLYINVECMLFLLYRTSLAFFRFWLFFYPPAFYFHFHFQLAWFPAEEANWSPASNKKKWAHFITYTNTPLIYLYSPKFSVATLWLLSRFLRS